MILINKTMETITEESAEQWMGYENTEFSFRELVNELEGLEPSQSPITNTTSVWFTSYGDMDYRTGEYEKYSLHYSRDNKPASLKYWVAAIKGSRYTGHR